MTVARELQSDNGRPTTYHTVARDIRIVGGPGISVSTDAKSVLIDGLTVIGGTGAAVTIGTPATHLASPLKASSLQQRYTTHFAVFLVAVVSTVVGGAILFYLGMM